MTQLESRLASCILVLDGAMGTMIMKKGLDEATFRGSRFAGHPVALKGCNDILCLTRPDIISSIHREYLDAGADIISTDTFNANDLSLAGYALSDHVSEICRAGARIAAQAVTQYCADNNIPSRLRPLVAGSMGPTGISLSVQDTSAASCDFDTMADAYCRQAIALIEGGVDLLLLETIFDTLNAKAASYGIHRAFDITGNTMPLMLSATLTEQGRLLSGQSISQFVDAMRHCGAISIGLNCGFGAEALRPWIETLSDSTTTYVSLHPNAGLPDDMGIYRDTPEKMLAELTPILESGHVNIVGGCCGTTPDHIRLIAREARRHQPRQPRQPNTTAPTPFIKVGERCNVAGSRKFLRLVGEADWSQCLDIAAGQIDKGASILDINMDDAMLDAPQAMATFVSMLTIDPRTSATPLMIDSSDFRVISRALRLMPLRGIVNSISLKNGETEFIERAKEIHRLGCAMVVMAFDERGQADTLDRRIDICSRAYRLLTGTAGIPPSDIIFDPNVLAVATGIEAHADYALDFIRTTAWIKKNLPEASVSGGISNLSFAFRGIDPVRKAMHAIFLEHNIASGMDMAIINPSTPLSSSWVEDDLHRLIDDVLLNTSPDATAHLVAYAMRLKDQIAAEKQQNKNIALKSAPQDSTTPASACERLAHNLMSGDTQSLEPLIARAMDECDGSAMAVVNNALIKGMNIVGERFGRGEMFLPQVVRSATFMNRAMDILTPAIENRSQYATDDTTAQTRPLIVLATVKGDVHDIGKNIVAIVLRCSGFEVLDLGVMTPPERIIETAVKNNAAAIGLSGLITPSLHEMTIVADMMQRHGMTIPLFVGGATTSDLHTAVKIAPCYSGPVVHTTDAATLPGTLTLFTSPDTKDEAINNLREQQQRLRDGYASRSSTLTLDEARKRAAVVDSPAPAPRHIGTYMLDIDIASVIPLINRRAFLSEWNLDPSDDTTPEAVRIINDATSLLHHISGPVKSKVIITDAHRDDNDNIIIGQEESQLILPTLRSLTPNPVNGKCLALSDFIAPESDHIALFTVTVAGSDIPETIAKLRETDEYSALLLQSMAHRIVEAATEYTHRYVKEQLWGLDNNTGIRPAIGYSSLPDQSLVLLLDSIIGYRSLGITITEHGALSPSATTTGLIIGHHTSRYFETGPVSQAQFDEYALRRGLDADTLAPYLSPRHRG